MDEMFSPFQTPTLVSGISCPSRPSHPPSQQGDEGKMSQMHLYVNNDSYKQPSDTDK